MMITEWDGIGEEFKANRFSDGFLLSQRPPPPLPRRASDPMGALAPPDRAPAAATDLPKKPRSSNLNIIPSSSKFSKGIPDPRVKTPVKTPSREARLAAVATPHAAARERERLRARERAQERERMGGAVGGGATLRTHDFECVGKGGKEGVVSKSKSAASDADDVPAPPKLDLMKLRARAAGNEGSVTERTINRSFQRPASSPVALPSQRASAAKLLHRAGGAGGPANSPGGAMGALVTQKFGLATARPVTRGGFDRVSQLKHDLPPPSPLDEFVAKFGGAVRSRQELKLTPPRKLQL